LGGWRYFVILTEQSVHLGMESFSPVLWYSTFTYQQQEKAMSKEQKSNKETKKLPSMTPKEKKAAKKAKKNERGRMGE
jgi:hypothetical protein